MIPLSGISILLLFLVMAMIFLLPTRFAAAPLLIGACYFTLEQGVKLGPLNFPVIRLCILAGALRALFRGERPSNGLNNMDSLMIVWSLWFVFSSFFHKDPSATLKFNFGLIFNSCGIYFLIRCYCQSLNDVINLCRIGILVLVPIALEMIYEKLTHHNFFSIIANLPDLPNIREGKLRAHGPFAHGILAGTVGATVLPMSVGIWQQYRNISILGTITCLVIIVTSASSGPVMSSAFAILAVMMWISRNQMHKIRLLALLGYFVLELTMNVPAYYILARIDISGGSTGWHRARLIESSFEHLNEWWFIGTDYTRHWMPTGVSWSPDHTDITNHYLQMGVIGGLPSMMLFISIVIRGFSYVGKLLSETCPIDPQKKFFVWCLGASLFAHAATSISVSYFDQSFVFLYFTIAAISAAYTGRINELPILTDSKKIDIKIIEYSRYKKKLAVQNPC